MLEQFILGAASFLTSQSPGLTFFEQELEIPAGVSEIRSEMLWNSASLLSTDGNPLPKIWYQADNGEMLPWHNAEETGHVVDEYLLDLLYVDEPRTTLVIKSTEPVRAVAHFYNTHIPGENLVAQLGLFDSHRYGNLDTSLPRDIPTPRFITRAEWGADETLRVWKNARSRPRFFRRWFKTEADLVPRDFKPKLINDTNDNGEPLFWPVSESPKIAKIVIHHTGENSKYIRRQRNPREIVRAIYAFHTKTRGWGDIGYNFLIDKQGNIYEGRAGGEKAVGGHTAYHNIGTIGISLMGNFQHEEPTEAQFKVLSLLLAHFSKEYDLDPTGRSVYLGTNSHNITGHRHVARRGHGTACPGKHLVAKLPQLRRTVEQYTLVLDDLMKPAAGRKLLAKSKAAPQVQQYRKFELPKKEPKIELQRLITKQLLQRKGRKTIDIEVKNGTRQVWPVRSEITADNVPEGMTVTDFRSIKPIKPGESGVFRGRILVSAAPNGLYTVDLNPDFLGEKVFDHEKLPTFELPIQVSGTKEIIAANRINSNQPETRTELPSYVNRLTASAFRNVAPKPAIDKDVPITKVKLAFFDEKFANIISRTPIDLIEKQAVLATIPANTNIKVIPKVGDDQKVYIHVETDTNEWNLRQAFLRTDGVLKIKNYERGLSSDRYNQFRRQLNFHTTPSGNLTVVNELPLEEYLWGLSEEPKTEPTEKKHAIHVLARSYAYVYSGNKRKFGTTLYDLEDDPRTSQYYLGYDWERYHSEQKKLVQETAGQVITFNDKPVIGPYFTQSSGRSSCQWQRAYPWAKCRPLPHDEGLEPKGHGVGLSGNSARVLAEQGLDYEAIIDYFFEGVEVKKIY